MSPSKGMTVLSDRTESGKNPPHPSHDQVCAREPPLPLSFVQDQKVHVCVNLCICTYVSTGPVRTFGGPHVRTQTHVRCLYKSVSSSSSLVSRGSLESLSVGVFSEDGRPRRYSVVSAAPPPPSAPSESGPRTRPEREEDPSGGLGRTGGADPVTKP